MASDHIEARVPSTSFEHPPLDKTKSQIRLLEILPQPDSSLHYSLTTFDISTCPPYIALSYVWGEDEPSNMIVINGQDFIIRDNLHCALPHLANLRENGIMSPLQRLMKRSEKHFWIDAICINQSDTKERNHQVDLMKDIFTSASLTVAWLGPGKQRNQRNPRVTRGLRPHPFFDDLESEFHLSSTSWRESKPFYKDKESLARNPYFKRIWIVQEVILSRDIWVICGSQMCTWGDLKRLCSKYQNLGLVEPEPDPDDYSWTDYGQLHFRDQDGTSRDEMANLHSLVWSRAAHVIRKPTLSELLYLYLDRECHDVRDRIYALLGLLASEALELSPLPVDYDISPEDLLEAAYKHLVENSDLADHAHRVPGLDWVRNLRIALGLPVEKLEMPFRLPPLYELHLGRD